MGATWVFVYVYTETYSSPWKTVSCFAYEELHQVQVSACKVKYELMWTQGMVFIQ